MTKTEVTILDIGDRVEDLQSFMVIIFGCAIRDNTSLLPVLRVLDQQSRGTVYDNGFYRYLAEGIAERPDKFITRFKVLHD